MARERTKGFEQENEVENVASESRSEPVSRVLYPCGRRSFLYAGDCSPALATVPERLERATHSPIWSCSEWGLACARDHSRAGGLLPRLFTLTLAGGMFSVPLSADRSAPPLAATLPYGARTFLPLRGDRPAHSGLPSISLLGTIRLTPPIKIFSNCSLLGTCPSEASMGTVGMECRNGRREVRSGRWRAELPRTGCAGSWGSI